MIRVGTKKKPKKKPAHMLKRKRTGINWSIVFDDATALKSVIEACGAVMQRVNIEISRMSNGYFLSVDGADVAKTCCVSARLELKNVTMDEEINLFSFCIECKQMLYSIDTPSCAHALLTMESYNDEEGIYLCMKDPDQPSHEELSRLNTFVNSEEPLELQALEFDLDIELDLTKLREMIKKARKARAEHISIAVYYCTRKEISTTVFSIHGDTQHTQSWANDVSTSEDGSRKVRAVADGNVHALDPEASECLHKGSYPVDKVDAFVRTVPARVCKAKAKKDMPLMLTHALGGSEDETSHVRFLVAPTIED